MVGSPAAPGAGIRDAMDNKGNEMNQFASREGIVCAVTVLALLAIFDAFVPEVITDVTNRLIRHGTLAMGIGLVMIAFWMIWAWVL